MAGVPPTRMDQGGSGGCAGRRGIVCAG
jgi:hypothetical protein